MASEYSLGNFPRDCEAYIFDLDGTLADSMPVHFTSWRRAFEEHGATFEFTWELFYQYAGVGGVDTIEQLERRFGQSLPVQAIMQMQHELLLTGLDEVVPIAEVASVAHELKQAGAKVAVASGGEREHVWDTLRIIGMEEFFPVVVTKDDVSRSKPDPETFLLTARLLGANPQRCLVFEDSELGVQAAQAAGMDWVYYPPDMQRFS